MLILYVCLGYDQLWNLLRTLLTLLQKMRKKQHRRGYSQEISTLQRNRDKDTIREVYELKNMHAVSSEHTRSTAITSMPKDRVPKLKHKKQFSKLTHNTWNSDNTPYAPEQVLKNFAHLLEPFEQSEIKEYRNIYYVGQSAKEMDSSPKLVPDDHFFKYQLGGHIAYRYEIIQSINRGSFGEVLKVYDHKSKQIQALKIVKKMPQLIKQTFVEISILTAIKEKDKDDLSGIVRIKDFTIFRDHICIMFELLDSNLYELIHANNFKGLHESFVRIFAIQILNSLNFLARMNVVHCDIKPENIVLKMWGKSGVKMIDFGTSCYEEQQNYTYIQSRYYRAPEIIFRRYYTKAIDMWSFGVMMAQLCTGSPLFPGHNDYQQLLYMIALLGYPDPEFSHYCRLDIERIRESKYLVLDQNGELPEENHQKFLKETGYKLQAECLRPLEQRLPKDQFLFIHFLKQILKWDPKERITPAEALQHPWIVSGLPQQIRQLHTIYQNLDSFVRHPRPTHKKRSKNKSISQQKSRTKIIKNEGSNQLKKGEKKGKNSQQKGKPKSKQSKEKKNKEKSKSLKRTTNKSPKRQSKF